MLLCLGLYLTPDITFGPNAHSVMLIKECSMVNLWMGVISLRTSCSPT